MIMYKDDFTNNGRLSVWESLLDQAGYTRSETISENDRDCIETLDVIISEVIVP